MDSDNGDEPRNKGQWAKGVSGNPAGRPRHAESLGAILARYGDRRDPKTRKRNSERLAEVLWHKALVEQDTECIKYIYDRTLGKPSVTIHGVGDGPPPLAFLLVAPGTQATPDAEGGPPEGQGGIIDAAPGDYRAVDPETEPQRPHRVQAEVDGPLR